MGWNDTFTEDDDWSAVSFVSMFWEAISERRVALTGNASNALILPEAGADVQSASSGTFSPPLSSTAAHGFGQIQAFVEANCTSFYDPTVTFPRSDPTFADLGKFDSLAEFRSYVGLNSSGFTRKYPREFVGNSKVNRVDLSGGDDPTGGTWSLTIFGSTLSGLAWNIASSSLQTLIRAINATGASTTTVSKSGFQYTITTPEIAGDVVPTVNDSGLTNAGTQTTTITVVTALNATATTYTDSSAFSNGHRARSTNSGQVYDRTGGAWVITSNPTGDAPDTVTTYGLMAAGDYIGAWIFNELRDAINAMTRSAVAHTRLSSAGTDTCDSRDSGARNSEDDWTTAESTASDFFDDATPAFNQLLAAYATGVYDTTPSDSWTARYVSRSTALRVSRTDVVAGTIRFLMIAHRNIYSPVVGTVASEEWDANGSGLSEDQWVEIDTGSFTGSGSSVTIDTAVIGSRDTKPASTADPTGSGTLRTSTRGYELQAKATLVDWDFEYAPA